MELTANSIYLHKRSRLLPLESEGLSKSRPLVLTIQKNIESLGYTFSKPLLAHLSRYSREELALFYAELIPLLREMRGAAKPFKPMYPNFPEQVMEASALELYSNAVLHYWSFVCKDAGLAEDTWLPEYEKVERLPLDEKHSLDVIHLGSKEDFEAILPTLLSSKSSLSAYDKSVVVWFLSYYSNRILPKEIPLKENVALLVGTLASLQNENWSASDFGRYVKTATDVLRIAVSLSGGDISLAENTKFGKFSRKLRRLLLGLLDKTASTKEDMVRHYGQWKRLGERLHPGEFQSVYPRAFAAFKALRNDEPIETFASKVEALVGERQVTHASKLLQDRPGEFARRLDHLLRLARTSIQRDAVVERFLEVAPGVSTPVLLQVYAHFLNRNPEATRAVFPKGQLAKVKVLESKLPVLDTTFCLEFALNVQAALEARFADQKPLGRVFVDPTLVDYPVPFAQRSASKALRTLSRGSRVPLESGADTVRFFIQWLNLSREVGASLWSNERVDLDLSAALLNEDFSLNQEIAFYNLREGFGCHSGDITNAPHPNGACEFIDISLAKAQSTGARYIAMSINSYTSTALCDLPECFAGWMMRQHPQSGEVFEARSVKNKVDLSANTTCALPLLIDMVERKVIWMDMALKTRPTWNTLRANKHGLGVTCQALASLKKPNLYDLFSMHARARGKVVKDQAKADVVFAPDQGITPFDIDDIVANYL